MRQSKSHVVVQHVAQPAKFAGPCPVADHLPILGRQRLLLGIVQWLAVVFQMWLQDSYNKYRHKSFGQHFAELPNHSDLPSHKVLLHNSV